MNYLLDTCVLSELIKPQPEPAVLGWMAQRKDTELFVSAITMAELYRGVVKLPESKRRHELNQWLQQVQASFDARILPFDHVSAQAWGNMTALTEAQGKPMATLDALIAATALVHGLQLVTRHVRDFAFAGIGLLNPWPAPETPAPEPYHQR